MKLYIDAYIDGPLKGHLVYRDYKSDSPDYVALTEIEIDDPLIPKPEAIEAAINGYKDEYKALRLSQLRKKREKLDQEIKELVS